MASMSQRTLLDSCADMVLACSDGRHIPCLRYHCLTSCLAIRHLAEDTELETDERGRCVVPFPNIDSTDLALAVDVLHEVLPPSSLDGDTAAAALRGLGVLGHAHTDTERQLLERLWTALCPGSLADIRPHINELLRAQSVRLAVLRRLVLLCPLWSDFSTRVLGALDLDLTLASWLLSKLVHFFPAGPLFVRLLGRLPTSVLDVPSVLSLFSGSDSAVAFHPGELACVTQALADVIGRAGWDRDGADWGLRTFFTSVLQSMSVYDVAPHIANTVHGSIVQLEKCPWVSVLLAVNDRRGFGFRKLAPWLSLRVDFATGLVDARISLDKLDDPAGRVARRCEVRLTAYVDDDRCEEWWVAFPNVIPDVPFFLLTHGEYAGGTPEAFRSVVHTSVARLRVDLFYAEHSVLKKANL